MNKRFDKLNQDRDTPEVNKNNKVNLLTRNGQKLHKYKINITYNLEILPF